MTAFCIKLTLPELWRRKGSSMPRGFNTGNLNININVNVNVPQGNASQVTSQVNKAATGAREQQGSSTGNAGTTGNSQGEYVSAQASLPQVAAQASAPGGAGGTRAAQSQLSREVGSTSDKGLADVTLRGLAATVSAFKRVVHEGTLAGIQRAKVRPMIVCVSRSRRSCSSGSRSPDACDSWVVECAESSRAWQGLDCRPGVLMCRVCLCVRFVLQVAEETRAVAAAFVDSEDRDSTASDEVPSLPFRLSAAVLFCWSMQRLLLNTSIGKGFGTSSIKYGTHRDLGAALRWLIVRDWSVIGPWLDSRRQHRSPSSRLHLERGSGHRGYAPTLTRPPLSCAGRVMVPRQKGSTRVVS